MVHTTMNKPPSTKLVDDQVVKILSRVPAKSLMRFQCVSKAWLAFTSNVYYQKKLPATISGLFYTISTWNADTSWSSDDKYLSLSVDRTIDTEFLALSSKLKDILDSCNGLLLCKPWHAKSEDDDYYVCNPAMRAWISLPNPDESLDTFSRLSILQSPTISMSFPGVFFDIIVHMLRIEDDVLGLGHKGNTCSKIKLPETDYFGNKWIGCSGGYLNGAFKYENQKEFWILEDYCKNEWVLKHSMYVETIPHKERSNTVHLEFYLQDFDCFDIVVFHRDLDVVFLQVEDDLLPYHLNSARTEKIVSIRCEWLTKFYTYLAC